MLLDSAEEHAADGDHVGGEEGEEGEGDDDVEGEGGAEVDEAEDAGADGGEVDRVEGDVVFAVHLEGKEGRSENVSLVFRIHEKSRF